MRAARFKRVAPPSRVYRTTKRVGGYVPPFNENSNIERDA